MLLRRPASVIVPCGICSRSRRADLDVRQRLLQLVRRRHQPVEDLHRDRHEARVRDPGAVVPVARLALLVGAHLGERFLVRLRVVLDRDLRRHAAHREGAAAVAGLDQQLRVRAQEVRRHRHLLAVRQHEIRPAAEFLDEAEDVVPAAAVEPDDVVLQLVQDLVHLERGENGLDQHRDLDRLAARCRAWLRSA